MTKVCKLDTDFTNKKGFIIPTDKEETYLLNHVNTILEYKYQIPESSHR